MLGSYVDVVVDARPIEKAIRVPRTAVHGGKNVFVMNDDDMLEIREVDVAWALPEALLISSGLRAGERIVTSRIVNPVPNTKLRLAAKTVRAQSTDPTTRTSRAMP